MNWRNLFSPSLWIGVGLVTIVLMALTMWLLSFVGVPESVSADSAYVYFVALAILMLLAPDDKEKK